MAIYTARVTSKGQVTIPAGLRRRLGIREGDSVSFEVTEQATLFDKNRHTVESVFGSIPTPPHLIGRDIDEMIEEATAANADRTMERMRQGLE